MVLWVTFEPTKAIVWALGLARNLPDKTSIGDQELWVERWVNHAALRSGWHAKRSQLISQVLEKLWWWHERRQVFMSIISRPSDRRSCGLDIASHCGNIRWAPRSANGCPVCDWWTNLRRWNRTQVRSYWLTTKETRKTISSTVAKATSLGSICWIHVCDASKYELVLCSFRRGTHLAVNQKNGWIPFVMIWWSRKVLIRVLGDLDFRESVRLDLHQWNCKIAKREARIIICNEPFDLFVLRGLRFACTSSLSQRSLRLCESDSDKWMATWSRIGSIVYVVVVCFCLCTWLCLCHLVWVSETDASTKHNNTHVTCWIDFKRASSCKNFINTLFHVWPQPTEVPLQYFNL